MESDSVGNDDSVGNYEEFINELYGMNEGGEMKYEKFSKLMEVAGLVKRNRIVKDRFDGDKDIVKEVISIGLNEMENGCSEYGAVEIMEEILSSDNIMATIKKQLAHSGSGKKSSPEQIKAKLADIRAKELSRRDKEKSESTDLLSEDSEEGEEYVGKEILKSKLVKSLKKNRKDLATKGNSVRSVTFPSLDVGGTRPIHTQSEITGYKIATGRMDKKTNKEIFNSFTGYIADFKDMGWNTSNEDPIFKRMPEGDTFDFDIINPGYIEFTEKMKNLKSDAASSDPGMFSEDGDAGGGAMGGAMGGDSANPSGSYVSGLSLGKKPEENQSNIVRRIGEETDEIDTEKDIMSPETTEQCKRVVGELLEIMNQPDIKNPVILLQNVKKIKRTLHKLDANLFMDMSPMFTYKIPNMFNNLLNYGEEALSGDGITPKYLDQFNNVLNSLINLNRDITIEECGEQINEQGIGGGEPNPSGQYDVNALEDKDMKGDTLKGSGPTWKKPTIKGGTMVKIKDKCNKYPYCNQGPEAIAEIAKRTGRDIKEINEIIKNFKQK
jgi:hypothetical protein